MVSNKNGEQICSPFFYDTLTSLLAESEGLDQGAVALDVTLAEVLQQLTTTTYHHGKAACSSVVLAILLQMLGEVRNTISEQGNLTLY